MTADLHRKKAAEIFGIPESEVTPEQRRYGKMANYSGIYSTSQPLINTAGTMTGRLSSTQPAIANLPTGSEEARRVIEAFKPKLVRSYRGYEIWQHGPTSFKAAGTSHGSAWSAVCYIDELLSP